MNNINELVVAAHTNAINKGWWEEDRTYGELISLVHSEVSEVLEDYRNGRKIDEVWYEHNYPFNDEVVIESDFVVRDKLHTSIGKPCGIPSELADICIRIFDIAGKYDFGPKLERYVTEYEENCFRSFKGTELFAEHLTEIHYELSQSWISDVRQRSSNNIRHLAYAVNVVKYISRKHKIDLEKAIDEKMKYNATRPQRHGGKVI
jgi:NTP pyrophosphatase (non-canonical NTP hydrolase)